jgi:hypothetical protein
MVNDLSLNLVGSTLAESASFLFTALNVFDINGLLNRDLLEAFESTSSLLLAAGKRIHLHDQTLAGVNTAVCLTFSHVTSLNFRNV